ncbi:ATP-binding cassette domain-containing protein [Furfurilactobacillus milii]|uniref:ATP-binding cassette domain-containing protein n=1 Tax=Furfurilactobacillus milii TaxID=2888272 RepID=A0A6N9I2R1_9LACO|nr:ABC transporter ATP-binding protein [Furfurilactobacillus milii]MYV17119.1 ATP-binding cassette domain-containing protein [Furfurilactobacillus milii]
MEIQLDQVRKDYGRTEVLHGVSFSLPLDTGNVFGLIGPNGAGKSTLMRLLSGITTINGGQLKIDTQGDSHYDKWAQRNSLYIPAGDRGLRNKLTPLENLRYFSAIRCVPFRDTQARMLANAKLFDAESLMNKEFDQMSTGQKKKATLLVAISFDTPMLLLDEPSNGLDMSAQVDLMKLVDSVAKKSQHTIILSSHDPVLMSEVTTQYIFVNEGTVIKTVDHSLSEAELRQMYEQLYQKAVIR